ncbi:hypothetical protein Pcaca05_02090 [Pectobacterium carotovorum subsp. carotovorum]|nr:hypothetical protein Pcaca05_02090 [Pectobacterium carotovorum subsp. carotovorum]
MFAGTKISLIMPTPKIMGVHNGDKEYVDEKESNRQEIDVRGGNNCAGDVAQLFSIIRYAGRNAWSAVHRKRTTGG